MDGYFMVGYDAFNSKDIDCLVVFERMRGKDAYSLKRSIYGKEATDLYKALIGENDNFNRDHQKQN